MSTQTPIQTPLNYEQHPGLSREDLAYASSLLREGIEDNNPDADKLVQELIGDIAIAEALKKETRLELYKAEGFVTALKEQTALDAAAKMESRGFAYKAPTLDDQLADKRRKTKFSYNNLPSHIDPAGWAMNEATEAEGLSELDNFLGSFLVATKKDDDSYSFPDDALQARSIRERLTFIGQAEYDEAARGIGVLWKTYLDTSPDKKLCVIAGISESKKYPGKIKSDQYLKTSILRTFSAEDTEKYAGRIADNMEDIQNESPENVRVVLLDDWTISGRQMSRVYSEIAADTDNEKFLDVIEVNLIAASETRIKNGLEDPDDPGRRTLPVRAYYKAHNGIDAISTPHGHITGLHSAGNYGFSIEIGRLQKRLQKMGITAGLLALPTVVSPYKIGNQNTQSSSKRVH